MIHVLLICRDPLQRERTAGYLSEWHTVTDTCENSVQSFAMLLNAEGNQTAYQVALVDQRQLDMDPIQFATSIRTEASLQDLAMILIAPPCSAKRREQVFSAGYRRIVETPLDKTRLFNALHAATQALPRLESPKVLDLTKRLEQQGNSLPPKDILIAESSEFTRRSICRILEKAGHHVFSVSDGEETLDALEHHHFDLAIVESEMQVISGIQVVKLHKFARAGHQWVPFILLTHSRSPVLVKQCENIEGCTILFKPVCAPELIDVVKRICQADPTRPDRSPCAAGTWADPAVQPRIANPTALDENVLVHLEQIGAPNRFLDKLVDQFIGEGERLISQLERALDQADYDAYTTAAHQLMDNASYMGAVALFEYGSSAARVSRAQFPDHAAGLTSEIRQAYENAREALRDFLRKRSDSAARH
jgi:two-component system sensor histidine kinase RpfC